MKLLYIDESYDKNFYVVGGILINDINYRKLTSDFNIFLKNKLKINENIEVKGDSIFNGRENWEGLSLDKRVEVIREIAQFLVKTKGTNFLITYGILRKKNGSSLYLSLLDDIVKKSSKITSKLGPTNKQLLIIFDERTDLRKEKKVYEQIAMSRKKIIKQYGSSCTIIDYGYEGISRFSRLLQIADFIAYFYRNYLSLQKFETLFNKQDDKRKIEFLKNLIDIILKRKIQIL